MKETKAEDDPEQQFAALLMHKFQLFRNLILETINAEHEKALVFTQEEGKRIADYAKISFFKHLRLYDFVLNNKQLNEVKRLTINYNEPIIATSLNDALLLGAEEALTYEDDVGVVRNDVITQREAIKKDQKRREEIEARKAQGISEEGEEDQTLKDEDLKKITDDRLRRAQIEKQSKLIIHEHTSTLDGQITKTMDEKARALEEKIAQGGATAKKK